MVVLLLINGVAGLSMLWLSHNMATTNALEFYPATLPIMYQAAAGGVIALAGLALSKLRFACLIVSSVVVGSLGLACMYAFDHWPGGDDGGAFGWIVLVGGGCVISFIAALVTFIVGICLKVAARPPSQAAAVAPSLAE